MRLSVLLFFVFSLPLLFLHSAIQPINSTTENSGKNVIVINFLTQAESCDTGPGYAIAVVSGGTEPYVYLWSNGEVSAFNSGLLHGEYTVTVTDDLGETTTGIAIVGMGTNGSGGCPALLETIEPSDTLIAPGDLTTLLAPFNQAYYTWNTGEDTREIEIDSAGTYILEMLDCDGCVRYDSILIREILPFSFAPIYPSCSNNDGQITALPEGTPPYDFLWSNGQTTAEITGLSAATYTITATDADNRLWYDTITITVNSAIQQAGGEEVKLVPCDLVSNDYFGRTVAIDGNLAVVGSYQDDDSGGNSGSIYIYEFDGVQWIQRQKIEAKDAVALDYFGAKVAISGTRVIASSTGDDDKGSSSGAIYVFDYINGEWQETQKLVPNILTANDNFGSALDIDGDIIIGGYYLDDEIATDAGAAYVFRYDGTEWLEDALLRANDPATSDYFGHDVGVSGNTIVVGAYGDDDKGTSSGSAYVFEYNGMSWLPTKLLAEEGRANDNFGYTVDIDSDNILVGAYLRDESFTDQGAAYLFSRSGSLWSEKQTILAPDPAASDQFSFSVEIDDDFMVIGTRYDDDKGSNSGASYVYGYNGNKWELDHKLIASDGVANDLFGEAVAISAGKIIVGSYADDDRGGSSGSAYIYSLCDRFDVIHPTEVCHRTPIYLSTTSANTDWYNQDGDLLQAASADFEFLATQDTTITLSSYFPQFACYRYDTLSITVSDPVSGTANGDQLKLLACDGAANDYFGESVDFHGDLAIVGARLQDGLATNEGAAYIYRMVNDNWELEQKLPAAESEATAYFGYDVAIYEEWAVVGAYQKNASTTNAGAVYVYHFNGEYWEFFEKIIPSTQDLNQVFGLSISLYKDKIAVSARGELSNRGAVYMFEYNGTNWLGTQKIVATDGAANDYFGQAIAMKNDRLIVGAMRDDDLGTDNGAAYIYHFEDNAWEFSAKIKERGVTNGDNFGFSVDIDGDYAVVGTRFGETTTSSSFTNHGIVYVFNYVDSIWSLQQRLIASNRSQSGYFGYDVAIEGSTLVAGSRVEEAYLFNYDGNTWTEQKRVKSYDWSSSDFFSYTIDLNNGRLLSGASREDDNGGDSGSAYIIDACLTHEIEVSPATTVCPRTLVTLSYGADRLDSVNWYLDGNLLAADTVNFSEYLVENKTILAEAFRRGGCVVYDSIALTVSNPVTVGNFETKILACDGAANDVFGSEVAISDEWAISGSPDDDDQGSASGSIYFYKKETTGWISYQKIIPNTGSSGSKFGGSLAIDGDVAVVGAHLSDAGLANSGAVYVYRFDGEFWQEEATLFPADLTSGDEFGYAVALNGNLLIATSIDDDDKGSNSGAVYVYEYDGSTWTMQQKLTASNGTASDRFGIGIDTDGMKILVGADYNDNIGSNVGSAYVFSHNGFTWVEEAILLPSDGVSSDNFGQAVAIDGDRLVVGSPLNDTPTTNSGSAYVFEYDGMDWQEQQQLLSNLTVNSGYFGSSVSISGKLIAVGAYRENPFTTYSGSTYLFEYDGTAWPLAYHFDPSDAAGSDYFGISVNLSDDRTLIVGSYQDDDRGGASGSAYIYELCNEAIRCDLKVAAKVFLEGPYDAAKGLMIRNLAAQSYLPSEEPYTDMPYFTHSTGGGGEMVDLTVFDTTDPVNDPDAIVDWLFVELRLGADSSIAVASRSALLQRDGDIVDLDGVSELTFNYRVNGDYWLAVGHRNHIAILSANKLFLSPALASYDFTTGNTFGTNAQKSLGNGLFGLYSGNALPSRNVDASDRSATWNGRNQAGYLDTDTNLDGNCDASDRSNCWNNRNKGTFVP